MNTVNNATLFSAVLALATGNRSALDFRNRSFVYAEGDGKDKANADLLIGATARTGIDADTHAKNLKTWKGTHFPFRSQVQALAKLANVTVATFDKELETMRLDELARIKAVEEATKKMEAAKGKGDKVAPATSAPRGTLTGEDTAKKAA